MAGNQNQAGIKTAYGTIRMNTGNWTGVTCTAVSASPGVELTGLGTNFTLMSPSKDFAMTTDGRLKYTGIRGKDFIVTGNVHCSSTAQLSLGLVKNGTLISGRRVFADACRWLQVISSPVSLVTNDYISLFLRKVQANDFTIYQANLSIQSSI